MVVPLIAAIFGQPDFSQLAFTINSSTFSYGNFVNAVFAFIAVAAAVFFFVVKPVNMLMERRKTEPEVAEETRQCPECLSSIPAAARRCAFCTAYVSGQPEPGRS